MKPRYVNLIPVMLLLLSVETSAEEPVQRFKVVADRMVDPINEQDYPRLQQDFGSVLLNAFPLSKSKPFFKDLVADYGKIVRLESPRLLPPNQAIFPARFERSLLDIRNTQQGEKQRGQIYYSSVEEDPLLKILNGARRFNPIG
jgi:hypothetical protein